MVMNRMNYRVGAWEATLAPPRNPHMCPFLPLKSSRRNVY